MLKYYKWSYLLALLAGIGGYYIAGFAGVWAVFILCVLEISLSFDNAVVNASILKNWGPVWRQRFITWGMFIAVFGMRLVLPVLIVGIIGNLTPWAALQLAAKEPEAYAKLLTSAHHEIAAFGGTFLMMVFLKFFLDSNKKEHWLPWIEAHLTKWSRFSEVLVLVLLLIVAAFVPKEEQYVVLAAGVIGLVLFIAVSTLGDLMGDEDENEGAGSTEATGRVVKEGLAGFMYLEVLDASFSFDGVIGAFAISNDIYIIMMGLAVGAMFVRSMTLMLLDKGTMTQFRYLEHGAFWAIGALASIMFISIHMHIPEAITGLIGAIAIGAAVWNSHLENKKDARAALT